MVTLYHIISWALTFVLFLGFVVLYQQGNQKVAKYLLMALRVSYILVLLTGVELLVRYGLSISVGEYIGKSVLGLITISFFELVTMQLQRKTKLLTTFLILLGVVVLLTVTMGLQLGLGWNLF